MREEKHQFEKAFVNVLSYTCLPCFVYLLQSFFCTGKMSIQISLSSSGFLEWYVCVPFFIPLFFTSSLLPSLPSFLARFLPPFPPPFPCFCKKMLSYHELFSLYLDIPSQHVQKYVPEAAQKAKFFASPKAAKTKVRNHPVFIAIRLFCLLVQFK